MQHLVRRQFVVSKFEIKLLTALIAKFVAKLQHAVAQMQYYRESSDPLRGRYT
tara:strand:- start:316 stop:474 length:159 start_codon:yes stop_codon:yes gene_type:complete